MIIQKRFLANNYLGKILFQLHKMAVNMNPRAWNRPRHTVMTFQLISDIVIFLNFFIFFYVLSNDFRVFVLCLICEFKKCLKRFLDV